MLAALALLPIFTLASPLEKRSGASIVTAISYISSNITQVNNTLNTFNSDGDLLTALTIQGQANDLTNSVTNAQSVVAASANLTESESGNVAFAVLNLEPQIFSLLDNIVAHKPEFETVVLGLISVDFLVESDLEQSKNASDAFGAALTKKLTSDYAAEAPTIIAQIDEHFNEAIAAFSN